jgi:fatty acid synthase subunit alpha
MGPTNIVAHELESHGVRTFSAKEMAFNILGLLHPQLFSITTSSTQVKPILADLNGGTDRLPAVTSLISQVASAPNSTKKRIFVMQLLVTTPPTSK